MVIGSDLFEGDWLAIVTSTGSDLSFVFPK